MSALFARQGLALRRAATPVQHMSKRFAHVENVVPFNMPFKYTNKPALAFKITVFMITGFSLPFIASAYQIQKAKGA